uniref:Transmembrane protein 74 n=1 Tax=Nothobranchius furzeri TaxID=105023 RepID=A0A8C6MFM2_NOTFU
MLQLPASTTRRRHRADPDPPGPPGSEFWYKRVNLSLSGPKLQKRRVFILSVPWYRSRTRSNILSRSPKELLFWSSFFKPNRMDSAEDIPELYLLSEDNLSSGGPGTSVDYGFILAVCCLVTGISLVAITYTVPRDVRVDPDSVSAREMEGLEREKAGVGAHLDRCVIAGLCLLTLGGVLLSTLLMVSMWKSEKMRRTALDLSRRSSKLYGSMSLRSGTSPTQTAGEDGV